MGIYVKGQDVYPAIISLEGRMFEARFVDFPNCVAVALTRDEVEKRAETALSIWLAVRRRSASPPPPPSIVTTEGSSLHRYVAYIPAKPAQPDARSVA